MNEHASLHTDIGELTLIATDTALVGLHWPNQTHRSHFADPGEPCLNPQRHLVLGRAMREIREYLRGSRQRFTVPFAATGSEFDRTVWAALTEIQYGETVTYGTIADRFGNPRLAQRVGQAVGANPIGIIIPCHRVLSASGSLTGFSGGLERKRFLLSLEEPDGGGSNRLF